MKKTLIMSFVLVLLLAACGPANQEVQPTQTAIKITVEVTKLVIQTVEKIVTATPEFSPTPTQPLPTPTLDETMTDKKAGVWLVGSEVARGKWRASGDCNATLADENGDMLDFVHGNRAIINTNKVGVYTIEFDDYPDSCTWSFLGK